MNKLPLSTILVILVLVAPAACEQSKPAGMPGPDAGDLAAKACANMAAAGCPEGENPDCADSLRSLASANMGGPSATCLAGAVGAQGVRACGVACGATP